MQKIIFLAFGLCLLTQNIWAQSPSLTETSKNTEKLRLSHSAFVPISLLYGGIGYDCRFRVPNSSVDFAASLSMGGGFFRIGSYHHNLTDIPFSTTVLFGRGWHSFELGLTTVYTQSQTVFDLPNNDNNIFFPNDRNVWDNGFSYLLTTGYRLQAPHRGIFLKVYNALGGGMSKQYEYSSKEYSNVFKLNAFGRIALGYTF